MERAPIPNIDLVIPSNVDINPETLKGKAKGEMTVNVQVPAHVTDLGDASAAELRVNGQIVSGEVQEVNKVYKVKVDRKAFIRALDGQSGEVEVRVSVTSTSGDTFVGVDTVNVEMVDPALSVKGPDSVKVGDSYSLTYAVNGEAENIQSFEMSLEYDSELIEFVSVEPLVEKVEVDSQRSEQPGEVSLVLKGSPSQFFNNPELFKVNMKAKETEAFKAAITLTDIAYTSSSKEVISMDDVVQSIDLYDDVSEIVINGEAGAKSIKTNRGTLQLVAQVSPANANQSVEWSVTDVDGSDTELATITSDGLLSANDKGLNGEVKVIAEAMDGSDVVGELIVEISNQLQLLTGTPFGAGPPWAPGGEFDKALDGDITTFYDYSEANGGYTGIDAGEDNQVVLSEVRFYPREGFTRRMTGGKIQGSNVSSTEGFVDLYTIPSEPESGWNVAEIQTEKSYRYLRYMSPDGGYGNIAELEFYTE
ncbi:cohesin domain-containing protein [Gracilibacillus sp. D59]|uniref:cohesin domain-containing protein n=1 Tax=Gracilibacillus sp. D59 TaxID=3457434 RepID=UPI003FCED70F